MVVLSVMPIQFLFYLFCLFNLQLTVSQNISRENITIVDTKTLFSLIDKQDDTLRVFNFWATWCKPCVQELPYFEELNRDQKNKKFILYLVSLDFKTSIDKKLKPFILKKKISSKVLLFDGGNPNDWIDRIDPNWSGSIPASLVSLNGKKIFEEGEFENLQSLNAFIKKIYK
ncbi:MAG: TlpA family protein disulfide reductase [Saprospiraceae bacterium]|jgi:thiol-disulfide isomerase/thioredoxin|nr:TlpA family protein disulfide reductase [Saprospiraceae bacterium]